MYSSTGYWITLITKFLVGQGVVKVINFISGILIIRFLPVSEYALYTLAGLLLVIGSIGSNFGLAQAVNTLGAKIKEDPQLLGSLYSSAYRYRRILYPIAVIGIILAATYTMYGKEWSPETALSIMVLVLITSWTLQPIALKKAILNIQHDADGLLKVGILEALLRLVATVACVVWPTAVTALTVNFFGVMVGRYFLTKRCAIFISEGALPDKDQSKVIVAFVIPLVPVLLYYMLQGQISVFLLSLYGMTASIAEIGALSRLGQVLALLMMLNAFIIQPYFARIEQKKLYIKRLLLVICLILGLCLLIMASVYWFSHWWLFILGEQYTGLVKELPLAILGPLLSLIGATLYSMVIARGSTRGQSWYVVFGLASQVLFISQFDIQTTFDALILNTLPIIIYTLVQSFLLVRVLYTWKT